MAQNALDGTPFSSGFARNRHNNRLKARGFKPAPADPQSDADTSQDTDQPQPITDNPEAMQCVDKLRQLGYTADDVAQAFDADSDQDQDASQDDGSAATSAAGLQLPGMQ